MEIDKNTKKQFDDLKRYLEQKHQKKYTDQEAMDELLSSYYKNMTVQLTVTSEGENLIFVPEQFVEKHKLVEGESYLLNLEKV